MTPNIRKKLFYLFFLAFIFITSSLIMYASGYKMNLTWPINFDNLVQKTGILIINSRPKGADIYINNQPAHEWKGIFDLSSKITKTPAKIKNLLPGEYDVRIELNGYHLWQKRLTILPAQSTFAEDIYLFKDSLPQLFKTNIDKIVPLSTNQAAISDEKSIYLFNLSNEKTDLIASSSTANIYQSFDDNYLIIENDSNIEIIDINSNTKIADISSETDLLPDNIRISKIDPDKIYYSTKDKIDYFDLNSNISFSYFYQPGLMDFIFYESKLITVVKPSNNICNINILNLATKETIKSTQIPCSDEFHFIKNNKHTNLWDAKSQVLYIIDPNQQIGLIKDVIVGISHINWVNDNLLLYANDFEIWLYDLSDRQKTLLTRISDKIIDIKWHPSDNYIIYSTNSSISIIELDQREKRNVLEIAKFENISNLLLNSKADTIYFLAQIGKQSGLFKLDLQ